MPVRAGRLAGQDARLRAKAPNHERRRYQPYVPLKGRRALPRRVSEQFESRELPLVRYDQLDYENMFAGGFALSCIWLGTNHSPDLVVIEGTLLNPPCDVFYVAG